MIQLTKALVTKALVTKKLRTSHQIEPPDFTRRPGVIRLTDRLRSCGISFRYIGGAVRDHLLGRAVGDLDLAVRTSADDLVLQLRQFGFKCLTHGLSHGVVTVQIDGTGFDLACLRRDLQGLGRHAITEPCDDWLTDAARRDFTVNALALDEHHHLFDYHGGLADLGQKRLRFIGVAEQRIAEDYLRILRYFRLAGELGWDCAPCPEVMEAIMVHRNGLLQLSPARIGAELLRLLAVPDPCPIISQMGALELWPLLGGALMPTKLNEGALGRFLETEPKCDELDWWMAGRIYALFGKASLDLRRHWAWPCGIDEKLVVLDRELILLHRQPNRIAGKLPGMVALSEMVALSLWQARHHDLNKSLQKASQHV
ncbi:MAG: hypothetical protein AAF418_03860 [Pseudomonadota bacterium]